MTRIVQVLARRHKHCGALRRAWRTLQGPLGSPAAHTGPDACPRIETHAGACPGHAWARGASWQVKRVGTGRRYCEPGNSRGGRGPTERMLPAAALARNGRGRHNPQNAWTGPLRGPPVPVWRTPVPPTFWLTHCQPKGPRAASTQTASDAGDQKGGSGAQWSEQQSGRL